MSDVSSAVADVERQTQVNDAVQIQLDPSMQSALCAAYVVDTIVEEGAAQLYEHYLANKEKEFVVQRTVESLKRLVEWQLPDIDAPEHRGPAYHNLPSVSSAGLWECEPEPVPAPLESWARLSVPTKLPLMRRREILQARRAASLHHEQQQALEAAQAAAVEQARQQSVAKPATAGHASVGSHLATITEGRDEGGDGRVAATGKVPEFLAVNKKHVLDAMDRKARVQAEAQRKAEKMAKEAGARDKAMRKALEGRKYTVDERGGVIVVEEVDPTALAPVHRAVEAGVDGQDDLSARQRRAHKHAAMGSPGRSSPVRQTVNQKLQRADAAASVADDPRFRKAAPNSQPSLLDSLSVYQPTAGMGLSSTSVSSAGRVALGLSPGVSLRESGRSVSGPPVSSSVDAAQHPSRRSIELKKQASGSNLAASSWIGDQSISEMPSSFGTSAGMHPGVTISRGGTGAGVAGAVMGPHSSFSAELPPVGRPGVFSGGSFRNVEDAQGFRGGPMSPVPLASAGGLGTSSGSSGFVTVKPGAVTVGGISLGNTLNRPRE